MNQSLENLYARRSIRKFTDKPVTDEQLHQLLKAAMCAPTAANTQCWHFVIMRDPAAREAIVKVHPNGRPLLGADLGIVILADLDREKAPGYFPGDCGGWAGYLSHASAGGCAFSNPKIAEKHRPLLHYCGRQPGREQATQRSLPGR